MLEINLFKISIKYINWLKIKTVDSHNNKLIHDEAFTVGLAHAYYDIFSLFRAQAEAFLIPLKLLSLKDCDDTKLLSLKLIFDQNIAIESDIPTRYKTTIISWFEDNIYLLLELIIDRRSELHTIENSNSDTEFNKGTEEGYKDIVRTLQIYTNDFALPFRYRIENLLVRLEEYKISIS